MLALVAAPLALAACGGSSAPSAKVATLGSSSAAAVTSTTVSAQDSRTAFLAYAACMRTNGVDMADPTFDANGNPTGGGFRDQSIDRTTATYKTAEEACRSKLQGVQFGGGGGRFDRTQIQTAMNSFTKCLRDNDVAVKDITLSDPGQGGGQTNGTRPAGGGFGAPPAGGSRPQGQNAPGGAGFNPTDRLIEQLGLDKNDTKVSAAITACQSVLQTAFQQGGSTTTTVSS